MKLILVFIILTLPLPAGAWDGKIRGTSEYVEIGRGQYVRNGEIIEYYNHDTGETHEAEVDSVDDGNGSTNVTVVDGDSGVKSVLEME